MVALCRRYMHNQQQLIIKLRGLNALAQNVDEVVQQLLSSPAMHWLVSAVCISSLELMQLVVLDWMQELFGHLRSATAALKSCRAHTSVLKNQACLPHDC